MFALSVGPGMQPGWELQVGELFFGSPYPARTWSAEGTHGRFPAAAVVRVPGFLPEDRFDRQPLLTTDGDTLFLCQVRLDNREELFQKLSLSVREDETPDSFLLQQAFLKWGESCVDHVYGDFAFAAYIRSRNRVFCAVDHGNHYRLFYRDDGGRLLVGTQLAALSRCPGVGVSADPVALGLLAEGKGPRTRTPFREVHVLDGGKALRWTPARTEIFRWWNPVTEPVTHFSRPEDYVDCARENMERAVGNCLRSSSPVSATLSGGLDSSLVAAMAARQMKQAGESMTVYTAAPNPANQVYRRAGWEPDDVPYAAETVALHDNLRHVILRSDLRVSLDLMEPIRRRSATPVLAGANHLWLDSFARDAVSRGSRVILIGAHGNPGISHSGVGAFRELWLQFRWRAAVRLALDLEQEKINPWKTVATGLLPQRWFEHAQQRKQQKVPGERVVFHLTTRAFRGEHADSLQTVSYPARTRKEFIRRATGSAMVWAADPLPQWGVELRDPTGDRRLLERLLTFPLAAFAVNGRLRGLARELGRDLLPDSVRLRHTRGQQGVDYSHAVRLQIARYRELAVDILKSPACCEVFDSAAIETAIRSIEEGEVSGILTGQLDRALDAALFLL